jgi:hypothetical protein
LPINYTREKKELQKVSGVELPSNVLRHTAGTAWYNLANNDIKNFGSPMDWVGRQIGNTKAVAQEFYVSRVEWTREVEEFFQIGLDEEFYENEAVA